MEAFSFGEESGGSKASVMKGPGWREMLDAYENRLLAVRAWLNAAGPAPAPTRFPDDLGPLPQEHSERAKSLLAEGRELEALVARAAEELSLVVLPRFGNRRPGARYLDASM